MEVLSVFPPQSWGVSGFEILSALISAFMAILFLQSGLDKVFDYQGNLSWLKEHFSKSILAGSVPVMLPLITLMECAAGLLSAAGTIQLLYSKDEHLAWLGLFFSALSLLMLFFGQRIAKDYAGAAVLVPYFILACFGLLLLS